MKKVLIFGADGFVGKYLSKEFKEHGYVVAGSDLSKTSANEDIDSYEQCDILDGIEVYRIISSLRPHIIVNLAAISSVSQSWRNPQLTFQVNVVGALNILEGARQVSTDIKILLVGSSEEYAPSKFPLDENSLLDASSPYGISKITQERIAEIYEEKYGLKIYRTRSFNHTGPGQSPNFVLASWCSQIASIEHSGKPGMLEVGNTEISRDFSDVRDIVKAYRLILESPDSGMPFNVGSGEAVLLREILEFLINESSSKIDVKVSSDRVRPEDNSLIQCDNSLIEERLGWFPEHDLYDTLREMLDEFRRKA